MALALMGQDGPTLKRGAGVLGGGQRSGGCSGAWCSQGFDDVKCGL